MCTVSSIQTLSVASTMRLTWRQLKRKNKGMMVGVASGGKRSLASYETVSQKAKAERLPGLWTAARMGAWGNLCATKLCFSSCRRGLCT